MILDWQKISLVVCLFALTTTAFIYKKTGWHFNCDDHGAFYYGKNSSLEAVKKYFTGQITNGQTVLASNAANQKESFFSSTYRPLTLAWYGLECKLLDAENSTDAWPYFVVSIILHGIAVALFFLLLTYFANNFFAFCAALAFATYPCMGQTVGPFCDQPFSLSLIFAILSLILFLQHLKRRNFFYLFLSTLFFAVPLFLHEIIIIYPFWLGLAALYFYYQQGSKLWQSIFYAALQTLPFLLVVTGYLIARFIIFPPSLTHTIIFDPLKILCRLPTRFYDLVTFEIDLLGLSWLKAGQKTLKIASIFAVKAWLILIFLAARNKKLLFLIFVGSVALSWPSLLMTHQARYLYYVLPFFLSLVAIGANSILADSLPKFCLKYSTPWILLTVAALGLVENQKVMQAIFTQTDLMTKAVIDLANNEELFNKSIFFVGVPHELLPCTGAQAVWMFGPKDQDKRPVIIDRMLNTRSSIYGTIAPHAIEENLLKIKIEDQEISIESLNPKKIWLFAANPFGEKISCTVGNIKSIQTDKTGQKARQITVELDPAWSGPEVEFVSWDYVAKKFIVLPRD